MGVIVAKGKVGVFPYKFELPGTLHATSSLLEDMNLDTHTP